ncbi:MAG: hypothetical protein CMM93_04440 [Rickettsiales bacterium]|nr:hypothetical protein [Rickettsiales bacterium]|tara:strand:- start:368 stop:808 length:441 start_codon:yes stop_codon:yes gene_type:complete
MITLLSTLIGFLSSLLPDAVKLYRDHQDRAHELQILHLQLQQQREGNAQRLDEIHQQTSFAEAQALYQTWKSDIRWVDALNGTVRPVLAYAFFGMYLLIKCLQYSLIETQALPWAFDRLWGEEDQAIFAGIIAFYFGQRAMGKVRK